MTTKKTRKRKPVTAPSPTVHAQESEPVTNDWRHRVKNRWDALSTFRKHWYKNIALGVLIELCLHVAGHTFQLGPLVAFENWGLDVVTRLNQTTCSMLGPGNPDPDTLGRMLRCEEENGARSSPVLVEVDAETWRSPAWGLGEPDSAPRDAIATLIERAFGLGATQVVLDILVEDHAPLGAPAPPPGSPAAVVQETDRRFADRLRALLSKPAFGSGRQLVLVRTERRPQPPDESAFRSELRHSKAVDEVVKDSNGRIVIAAPYFEVGADRRLRDWELFKVVCERRADKPDSGFLRVVPSVQFMTAAFQAAKCRQALVHVAGQPFTRCEDGSGAERSREGSEASWASATACTPFPAVGAANLSDVESTARACMLSLQMEGVRAARDSHSCVQARRVCRPGGGTNSATDSGCAAVMTRIDRIEAAGPGTVRKVWTRLSTGQSGEGIDAGLQEGYWSAVQSAFDPRLPAMPHEGGLGNRIVFRYTPDMVATVKAGQLLAANEWQLVQLGPLLRGRVVVIGQTFQEAGDAHFTPLGRMPGAVVLINAVDSMSRHGLMRAPTTLFTLSVSLTLIVVIGCLFALRTSAIAGVMATLIVLFTSGVASVLLFGHGVWLDFSAPIIGILIHSQWDAHKERVELEKRRQSPSDVVEH